MLFVDICLIWFLSVKAYRGGEYPSLTLRSSKDVTAYASPPVDTLDHYQIPIIGRLANALIDDDV